MAIVIDVKQGGFPDLQKHLERLEKTMERVEAIMARMAKSTAQFGRSVSGVPSGSGVRGGGPQRRQPGSRPPNNYDLYQYWNAKAQATGNRGAKSQSSRYLQMAYQDAQNDFHAGKAGAAARMNALGNKIASQKAQASRANMTKLQQLMNSGAGSSMGGAGMSALSAAAKNPYTAAAAAVVIALGAMTIAGFKAAEGLNKIASTAYGMGAPLSQSGFAKRLTAYGINADAAYSAAMSPGYARGVASQYGMNITGGPFGNFNKADAAKVMLKAIFAAKSEKEAIRMANIFGNPEAASLRYLTPENRAKLLANTGGLSEAEAAQAKNLEVAKQDLALKWERLLIRAQTKFLPVAEGLIKLIERLGNAANSENGQKALRVGGAVLFPWWKVLLDRLLGGSNVEKANERDRATDANTRALNENTRAMNDFREILGGGNRAQSVLPSGTQSHKLDQEEYRRAIASGVI